MRRLAMKTKLTVTIEADLVPKAKRYAALHGISLSQLMESALREKSLDEGASFSARWRGKLRAMPRDDERYRRLARKYL